MTNEKDVEKNEGDPGKSSDATKTIPKDTQNSSPSDWEQRLLKTFLLFSVVAASIDPLFFYIPTVNDHKKCLEMDETLKKTMLVFRSVMDLTYIFHIAFQITYGYLDNAEENKEIRRINWWIIMIDILCVLPIPQVVILVYFVRMKGLGSLNWRKFLNFILLFQFVPRIYRIYHSCKEFTKDLSADKIAGSTLVKGLFNLFLYIIASHFFGATWYLFSVQRESACWQHACKGNSLCSQSTFFCVHRNHSVNDRISGYLSHWCPLTPPSRFDFGMFTPALQSGVVNSMDFPRKFFYCFAWGLRTLSSFGSNLTTSTYFWESLFSAAITVIGLLLFLYLIGNLQTYLQLSAADSEKRKRKMERKESEADKWMNRNKIAAEHQKEIKDCVRRRMEENANVTHETLLNALRTQTRKRLTQFLCAPILDKCLQKEPPLIWNDEQIESAKKLIMEGLKPVCFDKNFTIFKENERLEKMLFFTQGIASACSADTTTLPFDLKKGSFFGEELLKLEFGPPSSPDTPSSPFPNSSKTVTVTTKVEAFALDLAAMKKIADQLRTQPRDTKKTAASIFENVTRPFSRLKGDPKQNGELATPK